MDDHRNYSMEPINTNDKFLSETQQYSIPQTTVKSETLYGNRETWPTQSVIPHHKMVQGNPFSLPQTINGNPSVQNPQKLVKKRHRQRRRRRDDKGKKFMS